MEPGYFCKQILKNPRSLKFCVSLGPLLSEMATLPPEKDFILCQSPKTRDYMMWFPVRAGLALTTHWTSRPWRLRFVFFSLGLAPGQQKPLCPNFYLNTRTKKGENTKNMQCLLERENKLSLILSLPPSAFRKQRDRGELFSLNHHFPPVRWQLPAHSSVKQSWRWPFLTQAPLTAFFFFFVAFSPLFQLRAPEALRRLSEPSWVVYF